MNKFTSFLILITALVFLQACDRAASSIETAASDKPVHRGYYIYGHEVSSFQPCGQVLVFWIQGNNAQLVQLQSSYGQYSSQAYEEVFVELTGSFAGKATDGFAMDYDGQFILENMLNMRKKSDNDCKQTG